MYIDDSWSGVGSHYKFTAVDVERYLKRARTLQSHPHTTASKLRPFVDALQAIRGLLTPHSTVLVLGSQEPWYEALLLAWGAGKVVTMEYNNLTYSHPQLSTVTPSQFLDTEGGGEYFGPRTFDVVVAVAAVDHDGLGRYGDPLAPDGDLLTMDWMHSVVKSQQQRQTEAEERQRSGADRVEGMEEMKGVEGGVLILTAPIGPDLVVWNLERRYGRVRLPLLLDGWEVRQRFGYIEEKLREEENFRKRFEPAWVLSHPTSAHRATATAATSSTTEATAEPPQPTSTSTTDTPHDEL